MGRDRRKAITSILLSCVASSYAQISFSFKSTLSESTTSSNDDNASRSTSLTLPPTSSSHAVFQTPSAFSSTKASMHVSSSTISIPQSTVAATGPDSNSSSSSTSSRTTLLTIGGSFGGFILTLIVVLVVNLARRRKRRHSILIPGIRHPFCPSYRSRIDPEPFSVTGHIGGPLHRSPHSTNWRDPFLTLLSPSESACPYSSTSSDKNSPSQYSPPSKDLESCSLDPPPRILLTFGWEQSHHHHPRQFSNNHRLNRDNGHTPWRWSGITQSLALYGAMVVPTSDSGNGEEGGSHDFGNMTQPGSLTRPEVGTVEETSPIGIGGVTLHHSLHSSND